MSEYIIAKNTYDQIYKDLGTGPYPVSLGQRFNFGDNLVYITKVRLLLAKCSTSCSGTVYCRIRKAGTSPNLIAQASETYDVETQITHPNGEWKQFTFNTLVSGKVDIVIEWSQNLGNNPFLRTWVTEGDIIQGNAVKKQHTSYWISYDDLGWPVDLVIQVYGSNIISVNESMSHEGIIQCDDINITNNAQFEFGGKIYCNNLSLDSGSILKVKGGASFDNGSIGQGAGYAGSGGGHGGEGGDSEDSDGNTQIGGAVSSDNPAWPLLAGAKGGTPQSGSATPGKGGGIVHIRAKDTVIINGDIIADGQKGGYDISTPSHAAAGSGAGGSVLIIARKIIGSGLISAKGADGIYREYAGDWSRAGAGGGGRIALYYDEMSSPSTAVAGGQGDTTSQDGVSGTLSSNLSKTLQGQYHLVDSERVLHNIYGIIELPVQKSLSSLYHINSQLAAWDNYNIYTLSKNLVNVYDIPYLHKTLYAKANIDIEKTLTDKYILWYSKNLKTLYDINLFEQIQDTYNIDFIDVSFTDVYTLMVAQSIQDEYTIWATRSFLSSYDINVFEQIEDTYSIDFIDVSLFDEYIIFATKILECSYRIWATKDLSSRYDINVMDLIEDTYSIEYLESSLTSSFDIIVESDIADTYSIAPSNFWYTETDQVVFNQGTLSNVVATSLGDLGIADTALSGYRISPSYSLSAVKVAKYSTISWDNTLPPGCSFTMEVDVSFDGGNTWEGWQKISNGDTIPQINYGDDVSNALLRMRQTLSRDSADKNPQLHDVSIYVKSKTGMLDPVLTGFYHIWATKNIRSNYDINILEDIEDTYNIDFIDRSLFAQYTLMVARSLDNVYTIWATKSFISSYDINLFEEIKDTYSIAYLQRLLENVYQIKLVKSLSSAYDINLFSLIQDTYSIDFLDVSLNDQYTIMVAQVLDTSYRIWATKKISSNYDINVMEEAQDIYSIHISDWIKSSYSIELARLLQADYSIPHLKQIFADKYDIFISKSLLDEYDIGLTFLLKEAYDIVEKAFREEGYEEFSKYFDYDLSEIFN